MIHSLLDIHVFPHFLLHPYYMMLSTFTPLTTLLRPSLKTIKSATVSDQALQGWAVTSRDGASVEKGQGTLPLEEPIAK